MAVWRDKNVGIFKTRNSRLEMNKRVAYFSNCFTWDFIFLTTAPETSEAHKSQLTSSEQDTGYPESLSLKNLWKALY